MPTERSTVEQAKAEVVNALEELALQRRHGNSHLYAQAERELAEAWARVIEAVRVSALPTCNCHFKERHEQATYPKDWVHHANWCALRVAALPNTEQDWQPIETAPKDRRWLLGWHEDQGHFVFRDGPGLITGEDPMPTHWMPLPQAPEGVSALPNTEQDLLRQAQESVCSLLCPSKWKTGERQPHSNLCRQITASLGATDEEVPQVQDAVVPEQRMVSQSEVPIESVDCLWPQATIQDRKRSELPMLVGSVSALPNTGKVWDCRICGFGVREGAALTWIGDHGEHYNAVSEKAPNNGTAYCPICSDETLRKP